jgi:hypothetical protein
MTRLAAGRLSSIKPIITTIIKPQQKRQGSKQLMMQKANTKPTFYLSTAIPHCRHTVHCTTWNAPGEFHSTVASITMLKYSA